MAQITAVALVVPDYTAGLAFYHGTLGWDIVEDIEQGQGKRWLVVAPPGSTCRILLAKAVTDRQRAAIGNQTGGRVGFFLTVGDFRKSYADMRAKGVDFEEEPRLEAYGMVAVWRDPFGNRWDLLGPDTA